MHTHVCSNRSRASVLTRSCRKFRSWEGFSWGALCRSVWLCASVSMYVCLYVFVLDLLISSRCVGLRASTITPSHCAPFAYSWGKSWSDFSHMADINIFAVHPTDIHMNGNMRSKSAKGFLRRMTVCPCSSPAAPPEGVKGLRNTCVRSFTSENWAAQ